MYKINLLGERSEPHTNEYIEIPALADIHIYIYIYVTVPGKRAHVAHIMILCF